MLESKTCHGRQIIFAKMTKQLKPKFYERSVIHLDQGDVMRGLKLTDSEFSCFGEVYISQINKGSIKGWKVHHSATLNLLVAFGSVRFVVLTPEKNNSLFKSLDIEIGKNNHGLLQIPPGNWLAFGSLNGPASIINVSNEIHNPEESSSSPFGLYQNYWDQ